MLVFNQQANIKNVNGAIADIFANRPAPQSTFYIFYSIDTQEIYYDNGTWVLIGTGGGGTPVNIYNSNGTLTGNRTLTGANFDLIFEDLNIFKTSIGGNDIGIKLDFANNQYILGTDLSSPGYIWLDNSNGNIELNSTISIIGQIGNIQFGGINTISQKLFYTNYLGNDIGLKFDFANSTYQFGQITGGNNIYFEIADSLTEIAAYNNGGINGLYLSFAARLFTFGDFNNVNTDSFVSVSLKEIALVGGTNDRLTFKIDGQTNVAKTIFQNNDIGLNLDFANTLYQFGQISGGNAIKLSIDDNIQILSTYKGNNRLGLEFDYTTNIFKIGDVNNVANFNVLSIEDGNNQIFLGKPGNINLNIDNTNNIYKTVYNANDIGLKLDFANSKYQFGQITGGNTTYLTIDDAATYPVQIDGTNVLSGSSGSTSGQHLKIKINGVDYKIELKNP